MSRNIRGRIRILFAIPSAAVLVFGASQALASPAEPSRAPDCESFCPINVEFCEANPTAWTCRYCAC